MIFVTVGTHEQQFDRLIKHVDDMKKERIINEEVIIQTGYSTYIPKFCEWKNFYTYSEMLDLINKAKIVITHGGPSSFITPLQIGKVPIVIPRQKKYDEHVNDHQVEFANEVMKRLGSIIVIMDINKLKDAIMNYETISKNMKYNNVCNNKNFCYHLENIVDTMFK